MKLTKLYIHNYKSFYDTTIELDKMNIVVGENNSGKSNLIDVLEFIDIAMSKDIERAISDKGGYENIKNYSAVGEEKVVIKATFKPSFFLEKNFIDFHPIAQNSYYTLSFSFFKQFYITSIFMEDMFILINKKYFTSEKKARNKIYIYSSIRDNKELNLQYFYSNIGICIDPELNIKNHDIYSQKSIFTYYFNSQNIKNKSNQDNKNFELMKDGSNLGKVLFNIKEKDENKFEIISNSLITTVNEIDSVEVQKVLGSYVIGFKERSKEPIALYRVSDGTINFLATMTALNQPIDESMLLVFEEPERHLHLKAVNYMLQAFRDSQKQILITTHSTEILKYANLEEIIFIYRDSDGDTQSIREFLI